MGRFEQVGKEFGKLVDEKQEAYGDSITKTGKLLRVFMEDYNNGDGTYTIPDVLIDHIALQVRVMDKQNRIFSNPKGDLMSEKPYSDIIGYGMLGNELIDYESDN